MSLVAYGSSDEEESDTSNPEVYESLPSTSKQVNLEPSKVLNGGFPIVKKNTNGDMFSCLPAPQKDCRIEIEEEDNSDIIIAKALPKEIPHTKQKVKITIPSLADFKDDDDSAPRAKKMKPVAKGSGLLAILPEPKNSSIKLSKPMVPHVLTKRPSPKPPTAQVNKSVNQKKPTVLLGYADSDEESGDEDGDRVIAPAIDFFSLTGHKAPEPAEINLEELLPPQLGPSRGPPVPRSKPETTVVQPEHIETDISQSQQDLQLDDEALRQLCGRRVQRGAEEVNIIELHGDNMMPDPQEWMLKQMTEEQQSHAHKSAPPSSAHRRKHQITYLAFQAKEREIELKNQWSQNRMTKKQTQAKYGF